MTKTLDTNHKQKMQTGREKYLATEREAKIAEILNGASANKCHCGITLQTTDEELRAKCARSCAHPAHICGTLDKLMRSVYQYPKHDLPEVEIERELGS